MSYTQHLARSVPDAADWHTIHTRPLALVSMHGDCARLGCNQPGRLVAYCDGPEMYACAEHTPAACAVLAKIAMKK